MSPPNSTLLLVTTALGFLSCPSRAFLPSVTPLNGARARAFGSATSSASPPPQRKYHDEHLLYMTSGAQDEGGEAEKKAKREVNILRIVGVMSYWWGVTSASSAVGGTVLIQYCALILGVRGKRSACEFTFRACRPPPLAGGLFYP